KYPENDINDLAEVLRDAGYKRVVVLTQSEGARNADQLPTARNIRDHLKSLLEGLRTEDTVLLAFSGHGVQFKGKQEHYFCPMDAELADRQTLVSLAEVYAELNKCQAGVKVLVADACRNDPLSGLQRRAEVNLESITRPQTQQPPGGVAALFSCSPGEYAFESDKLEHGIFFYYLIQGLKGKAANKKGEVHLEGLVQYIKDEVKDRLPEDIGPRVRQNPNLVGDLRGSFPLARYDRPVTPDLGGTQITGAKAITNTVGM